MDPEVVVLEDRDPSHHQKDQVRNVQDQEAGVMMATDPEDRCLQTVMDMNVSMITSVHPEWAATDMVSVKDQDPVLDQDLDRTEVEVEAVAPNDRDPNHHQKDQVRNAQDQAAGAMMVMDLEDRCPQTVWDMNVRRNTTVWILRFAMNMVFVNSVCDILCSYVTF